MAKGKRTLMQEYKHQRQLLERRVKSAEKAGFFFEKNPIPEAVKRPTKASIDRLKKLTGDTLRQAAKYVIKETGEIVSGRRGQYLQRKEAGEKAYEKRKKQEEERKKKVPPLKEPGEDQVYTINAPTEPEQVKKEPEPEPEPKMPPKKEEPKGLPGITAEENILYTFIEMLKQMQQQASKGAGFEHLINLLTAKWMDVNTDKTAMAEAIKKVVEQEPPDIQVGYSTKAGTAYFNKILSEMRESAPDIEDDFEADEEWEMPF